MQARAQDLLFKQLEGMATSAPTVHFGNKRVTGHVEHERDTHYIFEKKRKEADPEDAARRTSYAFHSRVRKIIRFD